MNRRVFVWFKKRRTFKNLEVSFVFVFAVIGTSQNLVDGYIILIFCLVNAINHQGFFGQKLGQFFKLRLFRSGKFLLRGVTLTGNCHSATC